MGLVNCCDFWNEVVKMLREKVSDCDCDCDH